jgi:uncharacterized membrane protein
MNEECQQMLARSEFAMESNPRLSPVIMLPLVTFIASAWLAAVLFYRDLPELLPTHWSASWNADGFTAKPWGPFVFPLIMTVVWLARRVLRHLSFPSSRVERFPGAFDFRVMLTIGLVFVIWTLVIVQSVFWLRALAVPVSIALVVAGVFVGTVPFRSISELRVAAVRDETDWLRVQRRARTVFVIAGLVILTIAALGR